MRNKIIAFANLEKIIGRGVVEIGFASVVILVPFYRIRFVRKQLKHRLPLTLILKVKRLSFYDTCFLWEVTFK